jgi:NAD(P)-dependent dehydrogenase (short-subunit alcohol dehydrogenase family)
LKRKKAMKKIFITGSTTGLGHLAAQMLLQQGHEVVLHARNKKSEMKENVPYVFGDLSQLNEVNSVADQANALGPFDAIIHNAGLYTASSSELFSVNVVAPYVLCCLMRPPKRMVFLSSGMQLGGTMNLDRQSCSYSDTKLFDLMLAKYFARAWPETYSNAVDPGWVPTRMGGAGAPDDLIKGAQTQVWLCVSNDPKALVSGKYFHHQVQRKSNPLADKPEAQDELLSYLVKVSGVKHASVPR